MLMNFSRVEFSWGPFLGRYLGFCLVFRSSTNRETGKWHVVVVQRRQRTLQKAWYTCKFVILLIKTFPLQSSSSLLKLPYGITNKQRMMSSIRRFLFSTWLWSGSRSDPGSRPWSRYSATTFKEENISCRSYILTLKPGNGKKNLVIQHSLIGHNVPCLPPKFCITIDCNTQEKLETMVMQNLGAKCIMVYVKLVNRKHIWCSSCRDRLKIYNILGNDTLLRLRSHGSGRTFDRVKIFTRHFLLFTRNCSLFSPGTHGNLNG